MIEFVDKTPEQNGTMINRRNMMAIQGFVASTITFGLDGSVIERNAEGHTLTTFFNEDGSITERFEGEKVITKTTSFSQDGSVRVVIS